jgi:MFS family permease
VNLRSPAQLALYAQGFLLMGAFVAYLAGTVSSPWAGTLASRHGRLPVLLVSTAAMAVGTALMLVPIVLVILGGLVVMTAGFFGAHAVASGWAPASARPDTRAQASSLYYLGYYGGSSLFGWSLGYVFDAAGWGVFLGVVVAMCGGAAVLAIGALREH